MRSLVQAAVVALVITFAWSSLAAARPYEYVQTWGKTYESTTCRDWSTAMTTDEQLAASADLLAIELDASGSGERPSYRQASDWRDTLTARCVGASTSVLADVSSATP